MIGSNGRILIVAGVMSAAMLASSPAQGAADRATCRVRNVTQGTSGTSFGRLADATRDGDQLRVRGVCRAVAVTVRTDVTIRGVGDRRAVLDGGHEGRVLWIARWAEVTLWHLAIVRGRVSDDPRMSDGGGIANLGTLTLTDVVVRDSSASYEGGGITNHRRLTLIDSVVRDDAAEWGGGLENIGPSRLTLIRSVIRGNRAFDSGGGFTNFQGGTVSLTDSVVRDNRAGYAGGGIHNQEGGTLVLVGSVVRGNAAESIGGGIRNDATLSLERSTVSSNTAGEAGGGIWNDDAYGGPGDEIGTVTLDSASSVTGNSPDDCFGTDAC